MHTHSQHQHRDSHEPNSPLPETWPPQTHDRHVPHRRIGEASNPGPPRQVTAQPHRECATNHDQPHCARCGSRWQTNASRALQTDNTPCMACGARGPQLDAAEQSVRPTLLHFICTTCAWHCCPGCAGVLHSTPIQETTGLNETGTRMTDQAKRRRSRTPEARSGRNTPGPSTKLRRRAQTDHTRADDESDSDDSSTSEVHLPDSVRRILDFEQWVGSTSTSSSEENSDEPPRSIPLLPCSEPDIPTPTGAEFTDFSMQTCSPTSDSPLSLTQPVRGKAASEDTAAGSGAATPQRAPRPAGRAHSPGDDELTDGYITDTDKDERGMPGPARQECAPEPPGPCDISEWTPPPKRHRATPSTARTAQATILDDTDESERVTQAAWLPPLQLTAHGVTATDTNYTTWSNEGALPSPGDSRPASVTRNYIMSVVLTNTSGGDVGEPSHPTDAGQHSHQQATSNSERGTTTPQQPAAHDPGMPNTDTRANASAEHNQIHARGDPE